jgi:hypothetical protein
MKYVKIIQTKYIGPTNNRGSRVKAFDDNDNATTMNWLYELGVEENHQAACLELMKKIRPDAAHKIEFYGSIGDGYAFGVTMKDKE